jgi:hypothetical protein
MKLNHEIKEEIKTRISSKTIPTGWRRVRNVAGIIATAGTLALSAPVSIPETVSSWVTYIVLITGTITGTSQLTKK